jgi:multidrug efflux pump subunit AcrA (membrane-fusion protein)
VSLGRSIEVVVEALAVEASGKVVGINPRGSNAARTFEVKVRLDDQGGKLKPGMSVLARIPTGEMVEVLTLPRDAVIHSANGPMTWAEMNGVAAPVPLDVLFAHDGGYAVHAGGGAGGQAQVLLVDQQRVVIEGAERLFPGQPLMESASR